LSISKSHISLVIVAFIKVKSLRPKRSEVEKSQPCENKRMRFLRVGRNDIALYISYYNIRYEALGE